MGNYISIAITLLVTAILGVSIFLTDTNSVKSSISGLLTKTQTTITQIQDSTD